MKTPEQAAAGWRDAFEVRDGDVQETSWSFIEGVIAGAIKADRAHRRDLVLSFEPDAIRDHFEAGEDDPTRGMTDAQLVTVGQDALTDDRLYKAFHVALSDAIRADVEADRAEEAERAERNERVTGLAPPPDVAPPIPFPWPSLEPMIPRVHMGSFDEGDFACDLYHSADDVSTIIEVDVRRVFDDGRPSVLVIRERLDLRPSLETWLDGLLERAKA